MARGRGGGWTTTCLELFRDLVRPLARRALRRLDHNTAGRRPTDRESIPDIAGWSESDGVRARSRGE
jgi:hypothetical protein